MKKEIKTVNEKKGIVQVTTQDERWYFKGTENKETGLPEYTAVPSVTWICDSYPKGIGFYKWLGDKGWDEAEALKQAAGTKGSKVHLAIADILAGKEVRIDSKYENKETGQMDELTLEECDAILSFVKWKNEVNPKTIAWEITIFNDADGYAGTIDYVCEIGLDTWIIDFKTSQQVWPTHELQVSAYKRAVISGNHNVDVTFDTLFDQEVKTGILQIGYRRNKDGYKFTEVDYKYDLFKAAQTIWRNDHGNEKPSQKDYPIVLSPALSDTKQEETYEKQSKTTRASKNSA